MKTSQNQITYIKLFSLVMFLVLITGCVERPLLLRNRPNVPPPSLDPESDEIPAAMSGEVVDNPTVILGVEDNVTQSVLPTIESSPITHTVQKGDSFWRIARQYGVSKAELAATNNMSLDKTLKIGTVLVIPPGGVANYQAPAPRKKASVSKPKKRNSAIIRAVTIPDADGTYTIQSGDSLWKISRKFGVSVTSLADANGLDKTAILKVGSKLVIPGVDSVAQPKKQRNKKKKPQKKKVEVIETLDTDIDAGKNTQPTEEDVLDGLLNDAVNAAGDDNVSNDPKAVLDGLDGAAATAGAPLSDDLYTEEVLPNETLQEIAERHGMKVEDILKVNPRLKANQKLKPFTSIKIPNKKY